MMFQPRAKLEFVRRFCPPDAGWLVSVDIDPSEEGTTGGVRKSSEARKRQRAMQRDAISVRAAFEALGVSVGGNRKKWFVDRGLPAIDGDRDIIAFQKTTKICVVAEVEADSSGQPEQKVYKAIGQIICAAECRLPAPWRLVRIVAVVGNKMSAHLECCRELATLGIAALVLASDRDGDRWLFGASGLPLSQGCPTTVEKRSGAPCNTASPEPRC